MKKTEIILGILAITALLLKVLDIAGGGLLAVLTLSALSFLYYFGFALFNGIRLRNVFKSQSYTGISIWKLLGAVIIGFVLAILVIGILFKIQLWPGGTVMLMAGLLATAIIFVGAASFALREGGMFYQRVFKRILIVGGIALFIYLAPQRIFVRAFYSENPEYVKLHNKVMADPDNEELKAQLQELQNEMDQQALEQYE